MYLYDDAVSVPVTNVWKTLSRLLAVRRFTRVHQRWCGSKARGVQLNAYINDDAFFSKKNSSQLTTVHVHLGAVGVVQIGCCGCLVVKPSNVYVWSSRVVVWNTGGPKAAGASHDSPRNPNMHISGSTKIQREDPEERVKIVAGEGKKRAKFWAVRRRAVLERASLLPSSLNFGNFNWKLITIKTKNYKDSHKHKNKSWS